MNSGTSDVTSATAPVSPARRALTSMLWLLLFSVVAKSAGLLKEVLFANRLGIGVLLDQYALTSNWALWIPSIVPSIAMAAMVPVLATLRRQSESEADTMFAEIAGMALAAGAVLGVATALAPLALGELFGDDPMFRISLPAMAVIAPAMCIVAAGSAQLVSKHRHANLMMEASPSLVIAAYLFLSPGLGLLGLSLATSAGYLLYALMVLWLLHRASALPVPRFSLKSPGWRLIGRASLILTIGSICAGTVAVVDQSQATLLGPGASATLAFANRVLMLPTAMLSMLITRSMLPIFSDHDRAHDPRAFDRLVRRFFLSTLALGLVACAAFWIATPWLIRLLFEHGSFTAEDTAATASAVRWGVLQLPAVVASLVVVQALLSQRRFIWVAISGTFNLVGKLVLNDWLGSRMGVDGITLSTSIIMTSSLVLLLIGYWRMDRSTPRPPSIQSMQIDEQRKSEG